MAATLADANPAKASDSYDKLGHPKTAGLCSEQLFLQRAQGRGEVAGLSRAAMSLTASRRPSAMAITSS